MSALDLTIPGEAAAILNEFGSDVTLTARQVADDYNRETRYVEESADIAGTIKASPLFDYMPSEIDGQNIKSGDAQAVIGATLPTGFTEGLLQGSRLTKGTTTFTVVNFEKVESGDVVAIYLLQLRK